MISFFVGVINFLVQVLTLLIIADVILSYFMSPYHPIRSAVDRIVQPMLAPIRRVVPSLGMIDFSPLILLLIIQLLGTLLVNILLTIH
jgi:YggT family protein